MIHSSLIELSKSALRSNIEFLKNYFGKKVRFSSVVKGNAYGHGIEEFVHLAEDCGIDHFSVFSASEALRVYKSTKSNSDIMIMGMLDNADIDWAIEKGIQFWTFDLERLETALKKSKKFGHKALIHIELETGFNRTGFIKDELPEVVRLIKKYQSNCSVEGICTHFAGSESIANHYRIQKQLKNFKDYYKYFVENDITPKIKHTACSAAAMNYPQSKMDLVRIGILQYGFWPSKETLINYLSKQTDKNDPLERIISWKSRIIGIKEVKTGEFIGYGTSFQAQRDTKIGIVPVGYSDGFSRSLSNRGRALVKGREVSVIGIVNMNHIIIDVTEIRGVKKHDEVVIIGNQHDINISVSSFSDLSDQLNYESLCQLSPDIPRMIKN
jgi:alanine racemase